MHLPTLTAIAATRDPAEKPITIAMFNVDMIGHCNPTFALVQQLVQRGCEVHYFLPPNDQLRIAAREAGAIVESYQKDDPSDLKLDACGNFDGLSITERFSIWPLASTLAMGEHVVSRCRDLGVDIVVYDPMAPHGLLVSKKLNIPCVSLITFPGLGSISSLIDESKLERFRQLREPLALQVKEEFGVDLNNDYLSRFQWLADSSIGENFVTTAAELEAPMPAASWVEEVQEHFPMNCIGCMANETAPHVTIAKSSSDKAEAEYTIITNKLPLDDLEKAAKRDAKVVYVALGTMALADRWNEDLGMMSAGNLPDGTTGKAYSQHIWRNALDAASILGDGYHWVMCIGKQADALDFLEGHTEEEKLAGLPRNVTLCTSLQQVEMLSRHAHVFVTHAGFNSLQESLVAQIPMIAVPQAVDQPANARNIEASGWGRAFLQPMSTVTSSHLADAVAEAAADQNPFRSALVATSSCLVGGDARAAERLITMARSFKHDV